MDSTTALIIAYNEQKRIMESNSENNAIAEKRIAQLISEGHALLYETTLLGAYVNYRTKHFSNGENFTIVYKSDLLKFFKA